MQKGLIEHDGVMPLLSMTHEHRFCTLRVEQLTTSWYKALTCSNKKIEP